MSEIKVKSCPFCGCTEIKMKHSKEYWYLECGNCQAVGPKVRPENNELAAWNKRHDEDNFIKKVQEIQQILEILP